MPLVDTWEQLAAAALLGTDRANQWPVPEGNLGALINSIAQSSREHALLAAAAAIDTYRRAGAMPSESTHDIPAAQAETLPPVSMRAGEHLRPLVSGRYPDMLLEWLEICIAVGKRAPERHLPNLLEMTLRFPKILPAARQVIGQRGLWLIKLNPNWQQAFAPIDESQWETAPRPARYNIFTDVRQRDPAHARQLLEKTWKAEGYDERTYFIQLMRSGLSMADEPFLEAALDDKRKDVRLEAADNLSRLPESRLTLRMIERAKPLLAIEAAVPGKILRKSTAKPTTLRVTLPQELSKDAERDGVEPKTGRQDIGDKAWWLSGIVAAIPPSHWSSTWKLTPTEILATAAGHDFHLALLFGWSDAAARHADAPWIIPLIRALLDKPKREAGLIDPTLRELMEPLTPAQREAVVENALDDDWTNLENDPRLVLLQACRHPWSVGFSRVAIRALHKQFQHAQNAHMYTTRQAIERDFGNYINPAIAKELADGWPTADKALESNAQAIETMIKTVQFRHDMRKELET